MSDSNAFARDRPYTSSTFLQLYSGPRYFELRDLDGQNANPSLFIRDAPPGTIGGTTDLRIFMDRAQLRELRDLLNRALSDEEYDLAYTAAVRAWETIGVS